MMDFRISGPSWSHVVANWNEITPTQYRQFRDLRDAVPNPYSDIKFTSEESYGHIRHLNEGQYEFKNSVRLPAFSGAMVTGTPQDEFLSFRARIDDYAQLRGPVELNGGTWVVSQAAWLQRHMLWNNIVGPLHQQWLKFRGKTSH